MDVFVLDSWSILAWLKREQPAAQRVRILLESAEHRRTKLIMNIMNLGEVLYVSAKRKDLTYAERTVTNLRARIGIVPATDDLVMYAATLKARHRISYADGFAAATAMLRDAPLLTGDPELRRMSQHEKALKLEWIGG